MPNQRFEKLFKKPANKPFKTLLIAGLAALGLVGITNLSMQLIARKQIEKTDAIAQDFLQNYTNTTLNDSARTLNVLTSGLGITNSNANSEEIVPDPAAAAAFQTIAQPLKDYIATQAQKTQGSLDPIPENLQTYLEKNNDTLTTIESHLRTQPLPVWDLDIEALADFSFAVPSFLGLVQLQQLLSLKAINDYQQNRPTEMSSALEANLVIQTALSKRPELISYLVSLISTNQNMGIVRHLEGVNPEISSQFLAIDQQQIGHERLSFESWISYQSMQKFLQSSGQQEDYGLEDFFSGLAIINYMPFHGSYLTLTNSNTAKISDQAYRQLPDLSVCTAALNDIEAQIGLNAPWWNMLAQVSLPTLIRQWQKGGQTMLAAELTHHITTAKALAAQQGQWPETLPNLDSQTCPGEQWVYEVSPEGEMSLSFSHDLPWLAPRETNEINTSWNIPLAYQQSYVTQEINK